MHRLISYRFAIFFVMLAPLVLAFLSPQRAIAGSVGANDMLYISVSLGGAAKSDQERSTRINHHSSPSTIGNLNDENAIQSAVLPDSLRFAGLAGALNLAIDNSGKSPLVDGIELAPRETLRFLARGTGEIRGLQGQISIRLDF